MKVIEFDTFDEFTAFENFRESVIVEFDITLYHGVGEVRTMKSDTNARIKFLNERLKEFNAVYTWHGIYGLPRPITCCNVRRVEFASDEDYAHFILKWS